MLGKNNGEGRCAPHGRHRLRCVHKDVGANRDRRRSGLFDVNPVVHTARAARASTANGHDDVIAPLRHRLDHSGISRLGGGWLAVVFHAAKPVALA